VWREPKSAALAEVQVMAQASGCTVKGYAPSSESAIVLAQTAGILTETVASLLSSPIDSPLGSRFDSSLSPVASLLSSPIDSPLGSRFDSPLSPTPAEIWVVDEAGLLSMKDAHDLLNRATAENARIILVGDSRQLTAVEAGNPFKSLQAGGIITARLDESLRQQTKELRGAVKAIAQGNILDGIHQLDHAGCVIETDDRLSQLVQDYMALSADERSKTLLLCGTHQERLELTQRLRSALQQEGSLGQDAIATTGLRLRDLTIAQASYASVYEVGDILVPSQTYKKQGLEKGQQYTVIGKRQGTNELILSFQGGNPFEINPATCPKKSVYQPQEMKVAIGDQLRWTRNDRAHNIRNGQTFTIVGFESDQARIRYEDRRSVWVDLQQTQYMDYAWVSTIYSAQGKTADRVLAVSDRTLNQASFYVACSRAKYQLTFYTHDKAELTKLAQTSRSKENVSDYLPILSNQTQENSIHVQPSQQPQRSHRSTAGNCSSADAGATQPTARSIQYPNFRPPTSARSPQSIGGTGERTERSDHDAGTVDTALAPGFDECLESVSDAIASHLDEQEFEQGAAAVGEAIAIVNGCLDELNDATEARSEIAAAIDRLCERYLREVEPRQLSLDLAIPVPGGVASRDSAADQSADQPHRRDSAGADGEAVGVSEAHIKQIRAAARTLLQWLKQRRVLEFVGKRYQVAYEVESRTLTLVALDGRGEILRGVAGAIVKADLEARDLEMIRRMREGLERERNRGKERQKPKGLEMSD
jgi:AAA domain